MADWMMMEFILSVFVFVVVFDYGQAVDTLVCRLGETCSLATSYCDGHTGTCRSCAELCDPDLIRDNRYHENNCHQNCKVYLTMVTTPIPAVHPIYQCPAVSCQCDITSDVIIIVLLVVMVVAMVTFAIYHIREKKKLLQEIRAKPTCSQCCNGVTSNGFPPKIDNLREPETSGPTVATVVAASNSVDAQPPETAVTRVGYKPIRTSTTSDQGQTPAPINGMQETETDHSIPGKPLLNTSEVNEPLISTESESSGPSSVPDKLLRQGMQNEETYPISACQDGGAQSRPDKLLREEIMETETHPVSACQDREGFMEKSKHNHGKNQLEESPMDKHQPGYREERTQLISTQEQQETSLKYT